MDWARRYLQVREATERWASPLSEADQQLQSMPNCSPTKWHRAHTTWFFETFLLLPRGVAPFDPRYGYLFNSYYEAVGPRHPRPSRGLVSRPSAEEIGRYRQHVDAAVLHLISTTEIESIQNILALGIAHEEQHQELLFTDILHAFSQNPLLPAYRTPLARPRGELTPLRFSNYAGGLVQIGAQAVFDNEGPRHPTYLAPYALSDRLVTVAEAIAFIEAKGYQTPSLWLSEGFDWVQRHGITAPGYVRYEKGSYRVFSLEGEREADPAEPVAHVSFFEADAIAQFLGGRLPTEAEWEHAADGLPVEGNFADGLIPLPLRNSKQMYGDVWQWTRSSYEPYPGYQAAPGALGEYNGKFMVNQRVLRGGSCLTPPGHVRPSYRNFWHPDTRFQMSGFGLAQDPR